MLALLTEAVSELLEEAEELDSELLDETALEEVLFAAELLDELDGFPQPAAIVNAITETTDIVISFFILFFMVILLLFFPALPMKSARPAGRATQSLRSSAR